MTQISQDEKDKLQQICICCLNCPHLFICEKNSYENSWCDYYDTYIELKSYSRNNNNEAE